MKMPMMKGPGPRAMVKTGKVGVSVKPTLPMKRGMAKVPTARLKP